MWRCFGDALGRLRRPGVPPRGLRLVYRLVRSPRLLLLELFASFKFRVAAYLASCSVHPAPAWSPRGLRLRGCGRCLALGELSGCSPLGVLPSRFPVGCLLPLWVVSAAAWELASRFFPYLFLWSRCRSMVLGRGSAEVLPSGGVSSCGFLRVACLRSGGGGFWMAESSRPIRSSGRLPGPCLTLSSSPLALHWVVSTSPVCLSRAPAFRQGRVAMLAEGSVESPSVLVLAFHSSLFLVEGSSDGSAPGDRSSPLDGCVYSLRF